MKRRDFLKNVGMLTGAGTISLALNGMPIKAFAKSFLNITSANGKILVLIQLKGGNDGINTVIPYDQYSLYSSYRPNIKVAESNLIKLTTNTALHPSLKSIETLFTEGKVALIQNAGYASPNRSHFRATDIWLSASDSNQILYDGWASRYLLKAFPAFPAVPPVHPMAIQLSSVPSGLFDSNVGGVAVGFGDPNSFYQLVSGMKADTDPPPATLAGDELKFLKEVAALSIQYATVIKEKADKGITRQTYPTSNLGTLGTQLKIVANLILGGLETPVYLTMLDGFDTHSGQVTKHEGLLKLLADSVFAFQREIEAAGLADKVVIMTFSEFGRRVKENASSGTDHGSAAPMFVIGSNVNGSIIGNNANLSKLDSNGDIIFENDFRRVYAAILRDHFGLNTAGVKEVLLKDFDPLQLIKYPTDLENEFLLPAKYELAQNYPNPFNPVTKISYSLPQDSFVRLIIYNETGQEVQTLISKNISAGKHEIIWDASKYSSGIYFYALQTNEFYQTKKMLLIK